MMDLPVLWAFAAAMAALTAWLLKRGSAMKTLTDAGIVIFLLVMMASMFMSAVAYLYKPTLVVGLELVALDMLAMTVGLAPILWVLFRGDRDLGGSRGVGILSAKRIATAAILSLVMVSEVFMGWTFSILSGAISTSGVGLFQALLDSMSTYWFVFTMAGEMVVTLYLVGRSFPRTFRWLVAIQVVIMVLSPTAIPGLAWSTETVIGNSAVMILAIILIFEFLFKNRALADGASRYIVRLLGAYGLMMAGLFLWLMDGNVLLFVASIVVEMVVYFGLVLNDKALEAPPVVSWQSRPLWTFALLGVIFVAEFFMGAVLDLIALGSGYFTRLPLVSIVGSPLALASAAFYDFVIAVSSVTASFWFLLMMGIEMGALVAFKIGYAREMETRIRLVLVLVAYAIYSLFLPYFAFPDSLGRVPWVGWNMGIGTAGSLAPDVLLALVVTYLVSGGLSFLFGSRQVCSLLCTAALMYQGTTYDAMSSFNRTSRIGRHLLTSHISGAYRVVISAVWISLFGSAVLSYLTSAGVVDVSVFGTDVAYFLYSFYFSFLWYLVWVMIPFVGTYGCSTTGMCGWGSFNQLVSRLGVFRLKVRDSDTCISCKTKDCAKVCPVGLTDMPGAFIDKGEFRSFKCAGVGDCVTACPYENVYFFDVRNWFRTRMNKPLPPLAKTPPKQVGTPVEFGSVVERAKER